MWLEAFNSIIFILKSIIYFVIFLLWACFWSFIEVIISRYHQWMKLKDILLKRSHCENCKTTLWIFNLFPIFSFIFQKWKCKKCWYKIPMRLLVAEIIFWIVLLSVFLIGQKNFPFEINYQQLMFTAFFFFSFNVGWLVGGIFWRNQK